MCRKLLTIIRDFLMNFHANRLFADRLSKKKKYGKILKYPFVYLKDKNQEESNEYDRYQSTNFNYPKDAAILPTRFAS